MDARDESALELLSVSQAARELRTSRERLYRALATGELRAATYGGKRPKVTRGDLDVWLHR